MYQKNDTAMKKVMLFSTILYGIVAYAQSEMADTVSVRQLNEIVVRGEKPQVRAEEGIMTVDLPDIVKDKPDRKSTRHNSSHRHTSRMPSSA